MKTEKDTTSERETDPRVIVGMIKPRCTEAAGSHDYMERQDEEHEGGESRYVFSCPGPDCEVRVEVVFPEPGSATEQEILRAKETELHPDDGVSLATVGFHCVRDPAHGWMRRASKLPIPQTSPPKSEYLYRCDGCTEVVIIVDRKPAENESPATS